MVETNDGPQTVEELLNNLFSYHKPFADQPTRYEQLRTQGKALAAAIFALTPQSREQANAIDSLRQAVMWANAAIACNEFEPAAIPAEIGAPIPSVAGPSHIDGDGAQAPAEAEAVAA